MVAQQAVMREWCLLGGGAATTMLNREEAAELLKNLTVADDGTIHHVLKRYRIVFQESSRLLAPRIAVRNSDCLLLLRAVHCCWKLFGREFAIDGFGQERSDDVKSYVRHVSNRIVTNLCTRKRTSLKKSDVAASPEDDAAKLREDCQNGLENSWLFSPSSSGARVGVVYSDDSEDGGGGGFGSDDE
uniref:Uncharacterized protein n=2 Tax=Caenorhabditis japonica TaxID=281687 RepID=A0A8R1EPQ5_CAEJA